MTEQAMNDVEFGDLVIRYEEISETDELCAEHHEELLSMQKRFEQWLKIHQQVNTQKGILIGITE